MSKWDKLLQRILSGAADANIPFDDLCHLLRRLGFDERVSGSHHVFTRENMVGTVNLQPRQDAKAKAYQVRQVRDLLSQPMDDSQENQ